MVLAVLVLAGTADARTGPWRPSCHEAQRAARITLTTYAGLLDGKLIVGPCAPRGKATRVTRVRVDGAQGVERFRVLVTGLGEDVVIRARHAGPLR